MHTKWGSTLGVILDQYEWTYLNLFRNTPRTLESLQHIRLFDINVINDNMILRRLWDFLQRRLPMNIRTKLNSELSNNSERSEPIFFWNIFTWLATCYMYIIIWLVPNNCDERLPAIATIGNRIWTILSKKVRIWLTLPNIKLIDRSSSTI